MLKDEDRRLLRQFQADPTLTQADLAARSGLSPARVARRLARLEETGVIKGITTRVDWQKLGYSVEVSLRITLDKTQSRAFDDFLDAARGVPEVLEIQTFLGSVDVRLAVIARDMAHYQSIYRNSILTLPHIAEVEALMHVARIKSDEALPV